MKKIFVMAAAIVMALGVQAQHVKPLTLTLVEYDLAALRTEHENPATLLAELQRIQLDQKAVEKQLKEVKKELKEEQNHIKSIKALNKQNASTYKALKKAYKSEVKSLDKLNKAIDKHAAKARKSTRLEEETRQTFLDLMAENQKVCGKSLGEANARLRGVETLDAKVQKADEILQRFTTEVKQKEVDLKQLDETHKGRVKAVKGEIKVAKASLKAASKK